MAQIRYAIVVGHADMAPWKNILEKGMLETWATPPVTDFYILRGLKPHPFLKRIDWHLWLGRYTKSYGIIYFILEKIVKKTFKKLKIKKITPGLNSNNIDELVVQEYDLQFNLGAKLLSCLDYFAKSNFDYLVLISTSSYLNIPALESLIKEISNINFIGGRVIARQNENLLSGTFRVFSKSASARISENLDLFDDSLPEDLALSRVLLQLRMEVVDIPSIDIPDLKTLENLSRDRLLRIPHYRLKSGPLTARNDVTIFHGVYKKLISEVK